MPSSFCAYIDYATYISRGMLSNLFVQHLWLIYHCMLYTNCIYISGDYQCWVPLLYGMHAVPFSFVHISLRSHLVKWEQACCIPKLNATP